MHIPDGLLPPLVCGAGYGLAGLMTWYSLRQINRRSDPTQGMPPAALLTAAFFVASSIHLPIPPTSVHLVLNGLLGVLLGDYAFLAILIGLFLQAVLFGHGGLTTLGLNAVMMGVPALLAYHFFGLHRPVETVVPFKPGSMMTLFAFLAGSLGLGLAVLAFISIVITTIPAGVDAVMERRAIYALAIAHGPVIVLEGIFTAMLVNFLQQVKPKLLEREF